MNDDVLTVDELIELLAYQPHDAKVCFAVSMPAGLDEEWAVGRVSVDEYGWVVLRS